MKKCRVNRLSSFQLMTLRDVVHPNERLPAATSVCLLTICCGDLVDRLFKLIQFYEVNARWCIAITRLSISMPRTPESQKQSPADPLRSGHNGKEVTRTARST